MRDETAKIREMLLNEKFTSVIMKRNGNIVTSMDNGVKPLISLSMTDAGALDGAFAADKVIGCAAAAILIMGGISECFGVLMSNGAIKLFKENGIAYFYDKSVPVIRNRDKNGVCPMEAMTLGLSARDAYAVLCDFFKDKIF